jgi:hypothetical protein
MTLLGGVVCLKHEGFHEELEWRAVYSPKLFSSPLMKSSSKLVAGIPQIIHELPLDVSVSNQIADLDFPAVFNRLIIGPSAYSQPMREAFIEELQRVGVTDAAERVVASGIPVRG